MDDANLVSSSSSGSCNTPPDASFAGSERISGGGGGDCVVCESWVHTLFRIATTIPPVTSISLIGWRTVSVNDDEVGSKLRYLRGRLRRRVVLAAQTWVGRGGCLPAGAQQLCSEMRDGMRLGRAGGSLDLGSAWDCECRALLGAGGGEIEEDLRDWGWGILRNNVTFLLFHPSKTCS